MEWFCTSCPDPQFSSENLTLRAQGRLSFGLLLGGPVVTQGSGLQAHGPAALVNQGLKLFLSMSSTVALISHKSSQTWFKRMHYSRLIIFHSNVYILSTLNNELRKTGHLLQSLPKDNDFLKWHFLYKLNKWDGDCGGRVAETIRGRLSSSPGSAWSGSSSHRWTAHRPSSPFGSCSETQWVWVDFLVESPQ